MLRPVRTTYTPVARVVGSTSAAVPAGLAVAGHGRVDELVAMGLQAGAGPRHRADALEGQPVGTGLDLEASVAQLRGGGLAQQGIGPWV